MARRAHRSSILSSSRTPDQLRVPRSEHLVHFSRRRCFEHNQRPEHLTCRRPRLDVARRAHPWPGTWCTYRRSQYERYSLAVTSDGKVGPSGVVLRPPHEAKCDNVIPPGPNPSSNRGWPIIRNVTQEVTSVSYGWSQRHGGCFRDRGSHPGGDCA